MNKAAGDTPSINVDFAQYVYKSEFEKHKKENEKEFAKIWEELENKQKENDKENKDKNEGKENKNMDNLVNENKKEK